MSSLNLIKHLELYLAERQITLRREAKDIAEAVEFTLRDLKDECSASIYPYQKYLRLLAIHKIEDLLFEYNFLDRPSIKRRFASDVEKMQRQTRPVITLKFVKALVTITDALKEDLNDCPPYQARYKQPAVEAMDEILRRYDVHNKLEIKRSA